MGLKDGLIKLVIKISIKKFFKKILKDMKGSWKTTLAGALAAIGVLLGMVAGIFDGGEVDWGGIVGQIMIILGVFGIGSQARDNDKRSEDVGAGG